MSSGLFLEVVNARTATNAAQYVSLNIGRRDRVTVVGS
jgi:hypothetical protein